MSGSAPPTPPDDGSDTCGLAAFLPAGYQAFKPEDHGLDRSFRLTAFSDLKGWGCKVPQEALLKLLEGLEPDRPGVGTGEEGGPAAGAGDEASEFGQLSQTAHGPRLGKACNHADRS